MSSIIHNLRIVQRSGMLAFQAELHYRFQIFVWMLSDIFQPFILAMLWSAAARYGDRQFMTAEIVNYYFVLLIVSRLTQDRTIHFLPQIISTGEFARYLLKPFNFLAEVLGQNIGYRFLRAILIFPLLILGGYLFRETLEFGQYRENLALFLLALILAFALNFVMGAIFSLLAFYIKELVGLKALYINLISILSGEHIPIFVLGERLQLLFTILPFRYALSFPIEILIGKVSYSELYGSFALSLFWLGALLLVYTVFLKISLKKYEAEGI